MNKIAHKVVEKNGWLLHIQTKTDEFGNKEGWVVGRTMDKKENIWNILGIEEVKA